MLKNCISPFIVATQKNMIGNVAGRSNNKYSFKGKTFLNLNYGICLTKTSLISNIISSTRQDHHIFK